MRDNGMPFALAEDGPESYAGLAQDALDLLLADRAKGGTTLHGAHLDHLLHLLADTAEFDPARLLAALRKRKLDALTVATLYVPEAARILGERWLTDEISFVDVTVGTERLHQVVRLVDAEVDAAEPVPHRSALILVAEAEQHTLGASVLAMQLRAAGFGAIVRVAPDVVELSQLMAARRFDVALVSLGCSAALAAGARLVKSMRVMSAGDMPIFVGGSIPVSDERLLRETHADLVLRDVAAVMQELDAVLRHHRLDGPDMTSLEPPGRYGARGDGLEA